MYQRHADGNYGELAARAEFARYNWLTYDADNPYCPDDFLIRREDDQEIYIVSVKICGHEVHSEGQILIQLQGNQPQMTPFHECHYDLVAGVSKELEKVFLVRKCDTSVKSFLNLRYHYGNRDSRGRPSNDSAPFHRPDWLTKKDFSLPLHVS